MKRLLLVALVATATTACLFESPTDLDAPHRRQPTAPGFWAPPPPMTPNSIKASVTVNGQTPSALGPGFLTYVVAGGTGPTVQDGYIEFSYDIPTDSCAGHWVQALVQQQGVGTVVAETIVMDGCGDHELSVDLILDP